MSEHTKEPWSINKTLEMVCDVAGENIKSTPANLRRIVACVNACAGISTSVLELQGVPSLELCKRLEQQRDELLAALEFYVNPQVYEPDSVGRYADITFVARAAIAKVKQP